MVVSIAGAAPGPDDPPCAPAVPVSVLQIHGYQDVVILYQGGTTRAEALGRGARYPSAADSVAAWRRLGPRGKAAVSGAGPGTESRAGGRLAAVRRQDFAPAGRQVSLWTVEGGGHHLTELRDLLPDIFAFMAAKLPR
jgi:poly(3-hydroxybutyrate) depolymerase